MIAIKTAYLGSLIVLKNKRKSKKRMENIIPMIQVLSME